MIATLVIPLLLFIGGVVHSNRKSFEENNRVAVDAVVGILIAILIIAQIIIGRS